MVYFILLVKYFIYVFLGGLAFYSVSTRFFNLSESNKKMYFLYSLGIGPAIASITLYYLYLFFPKQENFFYLGAIIFLFISMIVLNKSAIGEYSNYYKKAINSYKSLFLFNKELRNYLYSYKSLIVGLIIAFVLFEINYGYRTYLNIIYGGIGLIILIACIVSSNFRSKVKQGWKFFSNLLKDIFTLNFSRENYPGLNAFYSHFVRDNNFYFLAITLFFLVGLKALLLFFTIGHDFVQYLVQAEFIFKQKAIIYESHIFYPENGFYYVGLHGWSFPLQYSLECLVDDFMGYGYGMYFKSLTTFYGILIISVVYFTVKKHFNLFYACAAMFVLIFAKGFLTATTNAHIDAYRIFFFVLSFYFTLRLIDNGRSNEIPLLAFLSGTSAFAHSLGVIIAVIFGFTILFYLQKKWVSKIKDALIYGVLTLVFGGAHYIIDVFYGTGWIFKEIEFY
ncbi:hypothetical protein [Crocinitomix algicola]|uniref:hypothetical protein n=1 Tax=Crocinitomix algicola TaxID=1740263 RepID=UPI0008721ADF|nr:hypothetical protein [Crocinitomix algicola]